MVKSVSKGGRPTKITESVVRKLVEAFKLDVTVEEACRYAGISKDTYYRHLDANEGFSDEMEDARSYATMVARKCVIKKLATDANLALKYLERKRFKEFAPEYLFRRQEERSGSDVGERLTERTRGIIDELNKKHLEETIAA